jgi:DNA-binding CsgD family transcriptional regulator
VLENVETKNRNTLIRRSIVKKTKKVRSLTVRERILIRGLFGGLSNAEAMRQAGYSENTIKAHSKRTIVVNSRVQRAIQEILEEQGITDKKLAEVCVRGLDAKKVISATAKDFIEVDDYDAQHKFLITGLKLKGYLKEKVDLKVGRFAERLNRAIARKKDLECDWSQTQRTPAGD